MTKKIILLVGSVSILLDFAASFLFLFSMGFAPDVPFFGIRPFYAGSFLFAIIAGLFLGLLTILGKDKEGSLIELACAVAVLFFSLTPWIFALRAINTQNESLRQWRQDRQIMQNN